MSDFDLPKRPKRGEDEAEILRQMRDFEAAKASVRPENIKRISRRNEAEKEPKRPTSKFAERREKQKRSYDDPSRTELKGIITTTKKCFMM